MKTLDTYKVNFPTWALCALINDDIDTLSAEEIKQIVDFKTEWYEIAQGAYGKEPLETAFCIYGNIDTEPFFCTSPEFGLACNCVQLAINIVVYPKGN